jgi:hypothetical protein
MREYLKQLYSLSLSPLQIPLESFISCLVSRIPAPIPGGRPYHVVLDLDLIPLTSQPMPPIIFDLPSQYSFPFNETQFYSILKYFSIENILLIFSLQLHESKLLFLSHSSTLLTDVMESFRSLLFPLKWTSTYITKLPERLKDILHAPGGYLIGIQHHLTGSRMTSLDNGGGNGNGGSDLETYLLQRLHLPDGCYVIDLLHNKIFLSHHHKLELLTSTKIQQILKIFPLGSYRNIFQKLENILDNFQRFISLQYTSNNCVDSVYDMKLSENEDLFGSHEFDDGTSEKSSEIVNNSSGCSSASRAAKILNKLIRDAFLGLMCDLLGNFTAYFRPDNADYSDVTKNHYNPTLPELFNIEVSIFLLSSFVDLPLFPDLTLLLLFVAFALLRPI